uniref:Uncharacterized protein n=1 Tax=viral metagenome TaxID=1070528 RepID=A0A6C0ERI6_9ZZZZ
MTDSEFAKTHLRDHLSSLIVAPVAEGFWSIHASAKDLCERNGQPDQILRTFQNMLAKIPEWSDSTLTTEVERIERVTKCEYLDDLIMGVFISYMKSFASLHYQGNSKEIQIDFERPSLAKFVHEMYIHSARKLWQTAYLLNVGLPSEVQARNRQEVEKIIGQCLEQVIRGFLPWQAITKKYFTSPPTEDFVKNITSEPEPELQAEPEPESEEEEEKKSVSFGDEEDEEDEIVKLQISEEDATLDIPELDDPMKELESKISETLVLNL